MPKVRKTIELDEDTHEMLKQQAKKAKLGMRVYMRLCLIRCQSDKGVLSGN